MKKPKMYKLYSDEYIIYRKIYYVEAPTQAEAKKKFKDTGDYEDCESIEEVYSHNKITKVEKTKWFPS